MKRVFFHLVFVQYFTHLPILLSIKFLSNVKLFLHSMELSLKKNIYFAQSQVELAKGTKKMRFFTIF